MNTQQLRNKQEKEKKVVGLMIALYCRGNHGSKEGELCPECKELTEYAHSRINACPHMETKTFCSNCKTHCYNPTMRKKIRTVMRWSGPRMLFYHPVMAIQHLLESKKEKKKLRTMSAK